MFAVPGSSELTPQQRSGNVCIWCPRQLAPGGGVDLGGADAWYPRACQPCYEIQGRALVTYLEWNDHAVDCTVCRAAPCDTAQTLRHAHEDARERAGLPTIFCLDCGNMCRRARGMIAEPNTCSPLWAMTFRPCACYT